MMEGYGIDFPILIGFLFSNLISWLFIDYIITYFYKRRFSDLSEALDKKPSEKLVLIEEWQLKLDIDFGKRIGRLERVLYIYAIMFGKTAILGAWIVLKAFFGWIGKHNRNSQNEIEEMQDITQYYAYIYGNALSLIFALLLSHFGLLLSDWVAGSL